MYKRKIQARSNSYCCHAKAIISDIVCLFVCVSIAVVIQHAKRMRRICCHLCLSGYAVCFHIISRNVFPGGGIELQMCVLIFSTIFCVK